MTDIKSLTVDHMDVWTSAIENKAASGRGSGKKQNTHGIKKLRELILELAVRGKLVAQDPNDEPASTLLKKIEAEREQLIKANKIRKQKILPPIEDDEKPFELSDSWTWTRLGTITELNPKNLLADEVEASFVPMPLISTSHRGEHGQEKRRWSEIKNGYTHFADGDIALAKITPCFENGKAAVFSNLAHGVGAGTTELHVARPFGENIDRHFILLCLKSPKYLREGETKMTGSAGQKRVPKDYFAGNPLPLPPLAEQRRIFAKVDELMGMCDELEAQLEASIAAHETLIAALLGTLANSQNAQDLAENWDRISKYFDTLFTTEHSVDQFEKTILQLAAHGKLIAQDPTDSPATDLLKEIDEERSKLFKADYPNENEAKTQLRKLEAQSLPEGLSILPEGWAWATLLQCSAFVIDCKNKTAPYASEGIKLVRTTNVRHGKLNILDQKYVSPEVYETWSARSKPQPSDILITREAPMGEVCLIPAGEQICLGQRMMLARLVPGTIDHNFMLYSLLDPTLMDRVQDKPVGMTVQHLRVGGVESLLIPVPPLAEQRRISAKVGELMGLCKEMRFRISEAQANQFHLANAIVERAVA